MCTTSWNARDAVPFRWQIGGIQAARMKLDFIRPQSLESLPNGRGSSAFCLARMKSRSRSCCMKFMRPSKASSTGSRIRAFFEQLMIAKVGDHKSFGANLTAFLNAGFIAKNQRTAIEHILESGHAAIHRRYQPIEDDLNTALNIVETITATIFFHEEESKEVAARVPPRKP
jgi:Domain of unknown function (DUF4145)